MRHRVDTLLGVALTLVAVLASGVDAGSRDRRPAPSLPLRGEPFTVSGSCTALTAEELQVDGTSYRLDPDARLYEVGRGFVPTGTNFTYRVVSLTGVKVRNTMIVNSVLIRPDFGPVLGAARSPVRVKDASSPK